MQKSKFCPWSLVGALIFALCTVIGAHFAPFGKDVGGFGNRMDLLKYLPVFVVLTAAYYLVLYFLLNRTYAKKTEAPARKFFQFYEKHVFLVSFLVIALAWIPYVITFYPGSVCFDGYFQLNQVAGVQPLTNKHPIMSTFILGFFFKLGRLVNDNFGVFLYIMFQLLASSAIYALSIRQIRRIGMSLKVCVLAVLYFALVPVWGAYIQAVVKDTLYAAVFVWFAVWCVTLADEVFHKDKNIQRKTLIMSFLTAFFVCILRQNGKYIVLPTLVCLAAVSLKKWKQMVLLLLVFMFAITGYDKAVVPMFSTAQISRRAIFSVMFQQTAKYMRSYPEEVTEEEYEIIDKVLKADVIAEEYNPRVSNPVKNTFRNDTSNENVKEYLKVWFKMFWKHPGVYLEAFFQFCYGYLDPFHYSDCVPTFQNYITGPPLATGAMDIHYTQKGLYRIRLADYEKLWMEMFPLTLLTYPGTYTWLTLFCILLLCKKKRWRQLAVMPMLVFTILTNIASPVNGCLRYTLPLMAAMPLLLVWTVKEARIGDEGKEIIK